MEAIACHHLDILQLAVIVMEAYWRSAEALQTGRDLTPFMGTEGATVQKDHRFALASIDIGNLITTEID